MRQQAATPAPGQPNLTAASQAAPPGWHTHLTTTLHTAAALPAVAHAACAQTPGM